MNLLYNPVFLDHGTGMHPENRKRLETFSDLPAAPLVDGESYLPLVHRQDYIEKIKDFCRQDGGHIDQDTVVSKTSYRVACYAVGATIAAAEQGGFALVRPPGHHAYPHRASGFCLFNNVAIAAQLLANEGKRVLIFDFDGHLGDGTSFIFYPSDQVLYWSIHQYPAFPGHGFVDEIGEGRGKGFTVNVPLPPGSADDIFMDAVKLFLPIAKEFQPDVVAVSAGFDAHQYDLLLDLKVSINSFYRIGRILRENFGRVFATLEGGYNVEELYKGVLGFTAGFNGEDLPFAEAETVSPRRVWETYEINAYASLSNLKPYWHF